MKSRIQIVTIVFIALTGIIVGFGVAFAPPPGESGSSAPLEIALVSTPESLRVGQTWKIGVVVTNATDDEVTISRPRLGAEGVQLTISYRSTAASAEHEPDEVIDFQWIHPEDGTVEPVVLGAKKSQEFELISFPAVRAGHYEIDATFDWSTGEEKLKADTKEVTVIAGESGGETVEQLRMVFHTKSEDGQTGALRFQFLPSDGLATAIHVAAVASSPRSPYVGSPIQGAGGESGDRLVFGAPADGVPELPYSLYASTPKPETAKEDNLAGLLVDADNPHTGRARFEVVIGTPPEGFLGTHLPFARLVGGQRHANELFSVERDEKGFLKPRVVVEKVEFEPKAE